MFKAKINADVLKEGIDVIRAVNDDAVLNISTGGWLINVVDPANVALVSFELDRNAFSDFQFEPKEGEDKIKIGVDLAALDRVFDTDIIEKEVEVELKLDEQPEQKILFVKVDIFEYTLSLNDLSSFRTEPKLPKLNFFGQAIIKTEEFRRAIHAMERLSDAVMLGVDGEQFYMEAKDESNVLRSDLRNIFPIKKEPGNFHTRYSLEYLSAMCKGMGHVQNLTLNFGMDYPLQIGFDVGKKKKKKVSYLLAPRIDQEE